MVKDGFDFFKEVDIMLRAEQSRGGASRAGGVSDFAAGGEVMSLLRRRTMMEEIGSSGMIRGSFTPEEHTENYVLTLPQSCNRCNQWYD